METENKELQIVEKATQISIWDNKGRKGYCCKILLENQGRMQLMRIAIDHFINWEQWFAEKSCFACSNNPR